MKVLMLGWEYPPHNSGGLGVACQGLAQALAQEGVEVTFVLPRSQKIAGNSNVRFVFAGLPHLAIKEIDSPLQPYVTSASYGNSLSDDMKRLGVYGSTLLEEIRRYAQLVAEIARQEHFDVIHAHDWLAYLAGVAAKKASGKPLVLHVHATSFDQSGGQAVDPRQFDVEKHCMHQADTIVTVSHLVKNTIVAKHHVDAHKVTVIHNGYLQVDDSDEGATLDTVLTLKRLGKKIVLFLGRITIQKGPDYFLKAAQSVAAIEPNVVFIVSGSGDMEHRLINDAAHFGIADKVIFTGFTRGNERNVLYRSADVFVMPSVSEPFGLTPLEALSIGDTPTIISKTSGVSEVLQNTLTVDFWDTDELANKIIAVLRYEALHDQLIEYGRGEASGITWEKAAAKCIELYQSLVTKPVFA